MPSCSGGALPAFLAAAIIACCGSMVGCVSAGLAPIETRTALARAEGLTGRMRVTIRGPERRGRATVLFGFKRPDALRIEIPGTTGPRLTVVTRASRLCAVFQAERAVYRDVVSTASIDAALGVALTPEETMDLIVGAPLPRLPQTRVRWGRHFPREVTTRLPEGVELTIKLEEAEVGSPELEAFMEPKLLGYRAIDAEAARDIWMGQ
jgi:hypothetical protein